MSKQSACDNPPDMITSGYPEKLFRFVGWEPVQIGGRRAARRNRKTVLMPVYQAEEDGERMLVPLYSRTHTHHWSLNEWS